MFILLFLKKIKMIIQTQINIEKVLKEKYKMVHYLSYDLVSKNNDLIDYYSLIFSLVYNSTSKQDRFIINSVIEFFLVYRDFFLNNPTIGIKEVEALAIMDKMISRIKSLLEEHREIIYLYKPNIEVVKFCEYYWFNTYIVKTEEQLIKIIHKRSKKNYIL